MVRLSIDKAMQGADCYIFEVCFNSGLMYLPEQPLINEQGHKYGFIKVNNGTATVALVLPQFICGNNNRPFTYEDRLNLVLIKNNCEAHLEQLLGGKLVSKVKSIECNITLKVDDNTTPSDVLNLLNHASLSTGRDIIKYVGAHKQLRIKEQIHTIVVRRPHKFILKCYDKTEQQKKDLKIQDINTVPNGLLRIEIIMQERTIKKLFGDKVSFSDILTEASLIKVLREYKRIYIDDIINMSVKPYLNACRLHLVESLCTTESAVETIANEREAIPDIKVLRSALKEWKVLRGKSTHNLLRELAYYASKYNLPQNVIKTLKNFKISCG